MTSKTSKVLSKSQIMQSIANSTGVPVNEVRVVIDSLTSEITKALKSPRFKSISIPGLVRLEKTNYSRRWFGAKNNDLFGKKRSHISKAIRKVIVRAKPVDSLVEQLERAAYPTARKSDSRLMRGATVSDPKRVFASDHRGSPSVSGKYVIEFDPDVTEETRDRFLVKLLNEIHSANGEMTIISQCDGEEK